MYIYTYIYHIHTFIYYERATKPPRPSTSPEILHTYNVGLLETSKTVCLAQALKPMYFLIQGGVTNQLKAYPKKLLMLCLDALLLIMVK